MIVRAFLICVALMAATFANADTRIVNSPGDGFLNLRTGPGSGFAIIMPMQHGTSVNVLEDAGSWVRVQHESGATGWAFEEYLRSAGVVGSYMKVAWTSDGFLNLRTGPGTGFAIIRPMYTGAWVEVLEQSGNWVRVRHDFTGDVGWAYRKYLVN